MNRIARAARRVSAAVLVFAAMAAGAETNWVKDELRLNLRSGPGTSTGSRATSRPATR
jgi:uncharacterized protein YgiM (DUF1202 family)